LADYIFLMHGHEVIGDWGPYIEGLVAKGVMRGGSAMGGGVCVRKSGDAPAITGHIGGYIKVEVDSLDAAKALLPGNPVYEAGGVVEIRELPRTD
jgi:hypothetical protein